MYCTVFVVIHIRESELPNLKRYGRAFLLKDIADPLCLLKNLAEVWLNST